MPKTGSTSLSSALADAARVSKGAFSWFGNKHEGSFKFVLKKKPSLQLGQVDRFCDKMSALVRRTTGIMALHTKYFDFAERCT